MSAVNYRIQNPHGTVNRFTPAPGAERDLLESATLAIQNTFNVAQLDHVIVVATFDDVSYTTVEVTVVVTIEYQCSHDRSDLHDRLTITQFEEFLNARSAVGPEAICTHCGEVFPERSSVLPTSPDTVLTTDSGLTVAEVDDRTMELFLRMFNARNN